ncbi:MAG: DUF1036 domain-containing protein [Salinarimonadaceae bacterium]|nr:MAG: DUF1036 domain-containing protein [Salinarimonadaceae bacterium]
MIAASYSSTSLALRLLAPLAIALSGLVATAAPAHADLRICNMTDSRVGVALGYRDAHGWVTEGWWNLDARDCRSVVSGRLNVRYYYFYALDYDRGGEWGGRYQMCTRETSFTIRGTENCLARGYDRKGFFEIDTGQQRSWTIQLIDPDRQQGGAPQ